MPSTKKTTKAAAKPAASKSKVSKAKTTVSKTTSTRSKAKGARARAASSDAARSKAKSRATSSSKSAKSTAARTKAVARSAAKGASKTAKVKAAAAKTQKDKAKSAAKAAAAKASVTKKQVQVIKAETKANIQQKAKKPVENRAAAIKETSPEKAKATQKQKASATQNQTIAKQKQVQPAAPVSSAKPKLVSSKESASENRAPVQGKISSNPRPASPAPVVQPRDTSEQIPVTQKKSATPVPAKPAKSVAKSVPPTAAPPPAKPAAAPKPAGVKLGFKPNEHIVYPAHGVGQIVAIEEQEVAGFKLELFVISFVKDKMILKVPTPKVVSVGMRKLAEPPVVNRSLETLTGRARIKRTMWSRRAQEYEAKINSGDLIAIAEVVRDLYRSEAQPEQSYSERQLYEAALDRMSRELSVVQKLTEQESLKLIETQLQKGPRRGAKAEAEADGDSDGEVDEAA